MYRISISGQLSSFKRVGVSVEHSVGTEQVAFNLDKSWDGLTCFACFMNSQLPDKEKEKHVKLTDERIVTIPWEMYTVQGSLFAGVLGLRGAEIVKPTVWIHISDVTEGVNPDGEFAGSFTPSVAQQVTNIAQSVRKDADDGVFNGGYYIPTVDGNDIVFTPSKEAMPSVPRVPIPGGSSGTTDHNKLTNRDAANQHPMYAITGLITALQSKLSASTLPDAVNNALEQAKNSGLFDGADGATYTPTMTQTDDGVTISWANNAGLPNPETVTIKAPADGYSPQASVSRTDTGVRVSVTDKTGTTTADLTDGKDGGPGKTPDIQIGTVTTLSPTEKASASMTGTPEKPILNLGIPQGKPGEGGGGNDWRTVQTVEVTTPSSLIQFDVPDGIKHARIVFTGLTSETQTLLQASVNFPPYGPAARFNFYAGVDAQIPSRGFVEAEDCGFGVIKIMFGAWRQGYNMEPPVPWGCGKDYQDIGKLKTIYIGLDASSRNPISSGTYRFEVR